MDAGQDADEGIDRVVGLLVREQRCQELRIGRGRQSAAAAAQLPEQLPGVDEVAVVADRERPPGAEAERRLGVLPDRRPGRRIPAVGDREVAPERWDPALVEQIMKNQPPLSLTTTKKLLMGAITAAAVVALIGAGILVAPHLMAQSIPDANGRTPAFEVA